MSPKSSREIHGEFRGHHRGGRKRPWAEVMVVMLGLRNRRASLNPKGTPLVPVTEMSRGLLAAGAPGTACPLYSTRGLIFIYCRKLFVAPGIGSGEAGGGDIRTVTAQRDDPLESVLSS